MARQFVRLDTLRRDAETDLLAAMILAGWEKLMPLEEATKAAETLAKDNPHYAWELSGHLVRGEQMPPRIAKWVRIVGGQGSVHHIGR